MGFFLSVKTRVLAGGSVISLLIGAMSISPGSVVSASAAGQSNGHATYLGTTALAALGSGAAHVNSLERPRSLDVGGGHAAVGGKALVLPSPAGTNVSGSAGGATGFVGISNLDQLLGGTGAYAGTQSTVEPPDQGLCVGNGFVIESVNVAIAVYNTHGTLLTGVTPLNEFYKRSPEVISFVPLVFGDFLSDPKCYYDPVSGQFVATLLEVDAPGNFDGSDRTHVLIAVSASKDPTGSWNLYSIDTSNDGNNGTPAHTGCPCLPDQPLLGANGDGIFITENEFQLTVAGFPFNGAQLYALSRRELEEAGGGATPTFAHLDLGQVSTGDANLPFWGSVQPSTSPQPQRGTEWLMSASPEDNSQNNALVDNRIAVWRLTGTDTLNSDEPSLELSHQVLTTETYGSDVFNFGATQKSGPAPLKKFLASLGDTTEVLERLNANDSRMNQVTFADGKLFGDVNTVVTSPNRVGIAYFVVDVQGAEGGGRNAQRDEGGGARIANQGYLAVNSENVLFGAIGVNSSGSGTMVFTLSGTDYFPSAAYVRFNEHGAHGPIHVLAAGTAPEDGFTGYAPFSSIGIARWGDYSAAVPGSDGSIWMATEFIPSGERDLFANWGTFVSHVSNGENGD